MSALPAATEATFTDIVLTATTPVVVDFWAPWCAPCRQVTPVLEEIAARPDTTAAVVAVNADENPALALTYGIASMPTILVFDNGQVIKEIIGAKPKPVLLRELSAWIG